MEKFSTYYTVSIHSIVAHMIKKILFKGTAIWLWIFLIYFTNYGLGISAKYDINIWFSVLIIIVISALFQLGLYFTPEASNSKLSIRILCFVALMPTFIFINFSLFHGVYEIIFEDNILLLRSFLIAQTFVWAIYIYGITNLFKRNANHPAQ